jgi:uncharacterized protein (DUF1810 family)
VVSTCVVGVRGLAYIGSMSIFLTMSAKNSLIKFLDAQKGVYEIALREIKNGKKASHWMWYIFPQIDGLGFSETAKFYAIKSRSEAVEYLNHDILGTRLIEISTALLQLQTSDSVKVFGSVDSLKLKSSMTLFSNLENTHPVFQKVLDKFFGGMKDEKTIGLLNTTV